jgi:hypothetical protein
MIGHNSIGWTMPVAFEEYVKHFRDAQDAWTRLYAAMDRLGTGVAQVRQSPEILSHPSNQPWPTQQELREMFLAAQAKTAPLAAEFAQLPQDVKSYAPNPNTAPQRPRQQVPM